MSCILKNYLFKKFLTLKNSFLNSICRGCFTLSGLKSSKKRHLTHLPNAVCVLTVCSLQISDF